MSFFQKRFIQDKPTDAQESGQMYINFKKYATERFPDGITDEHMLFDTMHSTFLRRYPHVGIWLNIHIGTLHVQENVDTW